MARSRRCGVGRVHEALRRTGLPRFAEHREADFLAEVYVGGEPVSVADAEGIT